MKAITFFLAALLAALLPIRGEAKPSHGNARCVSVTTRPLSDFLEAQGSTSLYFPPVQDMLGWVDGAVINFGLVDYAGLANAWIEDTTGTSLGTRVSGSVVECELSEGGPAEVSVDLRTKKALGFAQSIEDIINNNGDFLNTPTIFGAKAQDVVAGADPALGPAHFRMTFVIPAAGAPLPDIQLAFQSPYSPDVRPFTLDFRSTTIGARPDGTRARLRIQEVGAAAAGEDAVFTREIVDIAPSGNGD